ncbi:MAG: hypothetical protein H0T72_12595 [Chloroflexia bacterium]|nr:hypothetical protein [Chloroflexia bacterium]
MLANAEDFVAGVESFLANSKRRCGGIPYETLVSSSVSHVWAAVGANPETVSVVAK